MRVCVLAPCVCVCLCMLRLWLSTKPACKCAHTAAPYIHTEQGSCKAVSLAVSCCQVDLCRPDPSSLHAMRLPRRYAHAASMRNQDVLRYRYSGGICSAEYKFEGSRPTTPAASYVAPSPERAYRDSLTSYSWNRVRALDTSATVY